jgi:hypothetical protein
VLNCLRRQLLVDSFEFRIVREDVLGIFVIPSFAGVDDDEATAALADLFDAALECSATFYWRCGNATAFRFIIGSELFKA